MDQLIATFEKAVSWQEQTVERLDRLIFTIGGPTGHGPN